MQIRELYIDSSHTTWTLIAKR